MESGATLVEAELAALDESVRFADALTNARKELMVASKNATPERVAENDSVLQEIDAQLTVIRGVK